MPSGKEALPDWVRFSIWGSPSRGAVLAYGWLVTGLASASVLAGVLVAPIFFFGILFGFGAIPYFGAVRWIDRHSNWREVENASPWQF